MKLDCNLFYPDDLNLNL